MEIIDEDMQMVRDWLAEHDAPFHIKSHFDNLVAQHAKEAARVSDLSDKVRDLKDAERDRDDLKEEVEGLSGEIEQRDSDQDRVLSDLKYWLHDVLVLNGPMRTPPRVMLRRIEEVLG